MKGPLERLPGISGICGICGKKLYPIFILCGATKWHG
jgi:hypothetical protein